MIETCFICAFLFFIPHLVLQRHWMLCSRWRMDWRVSGDRERLRQMHIASVSSDRRGVDMKAVVLRQDFSAQTVLAPRKVCSP